MKLKTFHEEEISFVRDPSPPLVRPVYISLNLKDRIRFKHQQFLQNHPNMNDLQAAIHRIRYRFDYMIMDYKQKYYTNSNNPRVIHTKLKDEILTSLRTFPHDKYKIKPGEFLSLEPKTVGHGSAMAFPDFEDDDIFLPLPGRATAVSEDFLPIEQFKENQPVEKKRRFRDKFKRDVPELSFVPPVPISEDISNGFKSPPIPPRMSPIGRINSTASKMSSSSSILNHEDHVWKAVFNDISLSAARVSTGQAFNKAYEFHNLSSDFIDAKFISKVKNLEDDFAPNLVEEKLEDVFASNLEQAKLMYSSAYDDGLLSLYCESE